MERLDKVAYNGDMKLPPKIDFAELCKELRARGRYTQQEIADLLEVNISTYQRWEQGRRTPCGQAVVNLLALRDYLNKKAKKKLSVPSL